MNLELKGDLESSRKILIVEDEVATFMELEIQLENWGYEPILAFSGDDAVKIALENKPDIILMDIVLRGELDGIDAAEIIKKQADIPIIYLTAYRDEKNMNRAKKTFPHSFLSKPFDANELKFALDIALTKNEVEKKLKDSEEHYRFLAENATDIIAVLDLEGTINYVSPSSNGLLGYQPNDLICKNVFDFLHPEDKDFVINSFLEIKDSKEGRKLEFRLFTKIDGYIWMESNCKYIFNKDSGIGEIIVITRDINERKGAENSLNGIINCFLNFGNSPEDNIKLLTSLCGEVMGGACALYNRIDKGLLHTVAHWNVPSDMKLVDDPEGHICYDVIRSNSKEIFIVHDLPNSEYVETDLNVRTYNLKTYIGVPVYFEDSSIGSLCVVYQNDYVPSDFDKKFMKLIGLAIGVEEERKKAKDDLERTVEEKEMLVREINHRVKNNLMVISNLLDLQSRYVKDRTTKGLFTESKNRARAMALIHERLYKASDLKHIDLGNYIKTLSMDLIRAYQKEVGTVKLELNVEEKMMDVNTSIPLGLILNELVSNSLKHAFPAKNVRGSENDTFASQDGKPGKIEINFKHLTENTYILEVEDDGIGFPEDFDIDKTDTLGLQIVNVLVRQIEGEMKIETDNGAKFSISFEEFSNIG